MKSMPVLLCLLLASSICADQRPAVAVIPAPQQFEIKEGALALSAGTGISADDVWLGSHLATALREETGLSFKTGKGGAIQLCIDKDSAEELGDEGYALSVSKKAVDVRAATRDGLFYGAVTLRQLLKNVDGTWQLPCIEIVDKPRFPWRGFMNDCSRTFISIKELRRYIDVMAFYKMNVFHLHLTDDQGWRFEVKKYPKLTQVAAAFAPKYNEPARFSGYYTQDELKELVRYAAQRGVELVPEIDIPGHCRAALKAYPELSVSGKRFQRDLFPFGKGSLQDNVLDPSNPKVYEFVAGVLDEVVEVFPSSYIHIGADEVSYGWWGRSKGVADLKRREGLRTHHDVQSYFVKEVNKLVQARGKVLIGWDEILRGGAPEGAVVMAWRSKRWHRYDSFADSLRSGRPVIAAVSEWNYLDYTQGPGDKGAGRLNTIENAYSFQPFQVEPKPKEGQLLGINAAMWTHIARETADIQRQVFPRLLAIAENAWSAEERKDFDGFSSRLKGHYRYLDRFGVAYWINRTIGSWEPAMIREEPTVLDWDVSGIVNGDGVYMAEPRYEKGKHGLYLHGAELLRDGTVVSTDKHEGFTGHRHENNIYRLSITNHEDAAHYTLRVTITGGAGTDSHGSVYLLPGLQAVR